MNIFQPLIDKYNAVTRQANNLHDAVKECHDLIEQAELHPCPACSRIGSNGAPKLVDVPATIDAPTAYGLAVRCSECGFQTSPQYWHLTEPESSAFSALYDAYNTWGFTEKKQQAVHG